MPLRKKQSNPEGRMTVFEHLGELRRRLMISIVAVVIAGTIVFIFAPEIISWLIQFYNDSAPKGTPKEIINDPGVRSAYLGNTFRGDEFG